MRLVKAMSFTAAVVSVALATGCASTRQEQQFVNPVASISVNYTIVRTVEGKGSASASPISGGLTAAQKAVGSATADAIGSSQDLDSVLAPKATVNETNFIIYSTATATVKGQGVKFTNPK